MDLYWVKSEADAKLIGIDEVSYYPQCSSNDVLQYSSPVCDVPGDSGLVVINRENVDVTIKVLIRHKI